MTTPARPPIELFGPVADAYAKSRPSYPPEVIHALLESVRQTPPDAVDIAAGTGRVAERLLASGARVTVVEPSPAMLGIARDQLAHCSGWRGAVQARAENLPIRPRTYDLVTVGQAFHWFDARPALAEFSRVLRSGGVLGVLWNLVLSDPFLEAVTALIARYNPTFHRSVSASMRYTPLEIVHHSEFVVEPVREFHHSRELTADRYVRVAGSWSYVGGALEPDLVERFSDDLRKLVALHHGPDPWRERMVTFAHFARRR